MKKVITISLLFAYHYMQAQYGDAGSCNINVNAPTYLNSVRKPDIDASFLWSTSGGWCSCTLLNRNTDDDHVGFYFLTARHCVTQGSAAPNVVFPGGIPIDFTQDQAFIFNFQSPDALNNHVSDYNKGTNYQSYKYPGNVNPGYDQHTGYSNNTGYEYFHTSKARLVDEFFKGDFALCEILTPLPPHFNVTYAGWSPNRFFYDLGGAAVTLGVPTLPSLYVGVAHPNADIKKITGAPGLLWNETPIATDCYTITTIIDALFGWIWGHSVSTQVICNYVDNPFLTIPFLQYGGIEEGSSGSGLFDPSNRVIGECTFGAPCQFPIAATYGKFAANYPNASIKNALNPSNSWSAGNSNFGIDLVGMPCRKISCYDNLILPGAPGVSGEYFPAHDYQSNNDITLQANGTIQTTQPINIYPEANYTFKAGTSITLGNGFIAHAGSAFVAKIQSCGESAPRPQTPLFDRLAQITLPKRLDFDINAYITETEQKRISALFILYPNPANSECTVRFDMPVSADVTITLTDMTGRDIASLDHSWHSQGTSFVPFSTGSYAPGLYMVRFSDGTHTSTQRLTISGRD